MTPEEIRRDNLRAFDEEIRLARQILRSPRRVRWTERAETIFTAVFALVCCAVFYLVLLLVFASSQ